MQWSLCVTYARIPKLSTLCIACNQPICNKCATASEETVPGYSEELKQVGKCPDCTTDFTKDFPDCSVTNTKKGSKPQKKVQKSIFASFGTTTPKNLPHAQTTVKSSFIKANPKQHKPTTTSTRTVTIATIEKWKTELATYNVSEWLSYDTDINGKVKDLKCKFSTMYENDIKSMPTFL